MKIRKFLIFLFVAGLGVISLVAKPALAAQPTLVLTASSGDIAQARVTGDPNSSIQLYYYPTGAALPASVTFGTTDNSGNFSTTISSGAYGIPAGVQSYVIINGQQSISTVWPSYSSTLSLSQTTAQLNVGQNLTISASNPSTVAYNSNQSALTTQVSGNNVSLTANAAGSGTLTICGANVGCKNVTFTVGAAQSAGQLTFSKNNVSLNLKQSLNVTISYANSANGFTVSANSNANDVLASISGNSNVLSLYGQNTGSATITVCSKADSSACSSLYVSVAGNSNATTAVTFSQNTVVLNYGQNTVVTASGDPNNNYFISSNSNSSAVSVGVNNKNISLTGNSAAGSATVIICSVTTSNICGTIYVTVATNSSNIPVNFSQNNISINNHQTINISVYGGIGSNYFILSNSNSAAVSSTIIGNTITLVGNAATGDAVINACSATVGASCANLYAVNTSTPVLSTTPISLSQNVITLNPAQTITVTASGGAGNAYNVTYNSGPGIVAASVNGSNIILNGVSSGAATLTVCSTADSSKCANIFVTVNAYLAPLTFQQANLTLTVGQTITNLVYYAGTTTGAIIVGNNSNQSAAQATAIAYNKISLTGGPNTGSAVISVCSTANAGDCANINVITVAATVATPAPTTPPPAQTILPSTASPVAVTAVSATLAATKVPATYKFTKQLVLGSVGNDVRELQKRLIAEGVYSGPVTGYFGAQTKKAVKLYQTNNKVSSIGVVGPATRALLNK